MSPEASAVGFSSELSLLRNAAETASDGFPTPSQAACAMKHGVNHALSRNEQDEKVKGPGLDGYSKWFQTFTMRGQAALNFRPERLLPKSLGKHLDDYFFVCDERGSVLYDKICQTPAYYTYRSDLDVVKDNAKEIAQLVGKDITFVDFGCGMCHKSINLLEALHEPHAFIALDIESEVLEQVKEKLKTRMPDLKVLTHVADFRDEIKLPADDHKKLGLCTGSTISVHSDDETALIVKNAMDALGDGGVLLMSFDINQNPETNFPQYINTGFDEFVLNSLSIVNNLYGANFDPKEFKYKPQWNSELTRMEQLLIAQSRQEVTMDGKTYVFEKDEPLRIYYARKRSVEEFNNIIKKIGAVVKRAFYDKEKFMALAWIEKEA